MAFTLHGFQFNRGSTTSNTQGEGITSVTHTYKSTDPILTITAPGYFPDNIDGTTDKVFIGDLVSIVASNAVFLCRILQTSPFTLSADLFASSVNLNVNPPIDATDNNGILVSGATVQLEYATATRPGILSNAFQILPGDKLFVGSLEITSLFTDFSAPVSTNGLQIRSETSAEVGINILDITASGTMEYTFGNVVLGPRYAGMRFSETAFGVLPTLTLENNGIAVAIDNNQVADFTTGITVPTSGGDKSLLDYFELNTHTTTFTNDTSVSNSVTFNVIRIGDFVNICLQGFTGAALTGATPTPSYVSTTVLPAKWRPLETVGSVLHIAKGLVESDTLFVVFPNGEIHFYSTTTDRTANFPPATTVSFGPGSISYMID